MRVDEALLAYEGRGARPIGIYPADPRSARPRIASMTELLLDPDQMRPYYDAIQQLKESLRDENSLDQSSVSVWKSVVEHYENEPNARGPRATCFDALNFQAWRLYFESHSLRGLIDADDAFARALPDFSVLYGEAVVATAEKIATSRSCNEECVLDLTLLWELLDLPPEVLPQEVAERVARAISACVVREQDFYSIFYPVVGFNSTLWRLFAPLTIDRALIEFATRSNQDIIGAIRTMHHITSSVETDRDVVTVQCAAALLDRVTRAPYAGNKFLIKTLLHFFYPVAAATRSKYDEDYIPQRLEILDRHLSAIAWCDERFIRRLQKAVDETWGLSTVDIGLVPHFCVDLSARAESFSTQELSDALVAEFGMDGELLLGRFIRSEIHGFFEGVARELDLNYGLFVGWRHWTETGHIVSVAERSIPQAQLNAERKTAAIKLGRPSARTKKVVMASTAGMATSGAAYATSSMTSPAGKPRRPLLGPYVVEGYDKDHFWRGYAQFRQLLQDGKGRTQDGLEFTVWRVIDDFVSAVAKSALSLPANASDDADDYKVNVAKLRAQYPAGGRENLATQIEGRFDYMVGRLIGRRIILATADESSKAVDLARILGYANADDNAYKKMAAYLIKCGLRDTDYQKPFESVDNMAVEGELEWLKKYR